MEKFDAPIFGVLVILCDKLKPVITASLSLVVLAIQDGDRFTFGTIVGA